MLNAFYSKKKSSFATNEGGAESAMQTMLDVATREFPINEVFPKYREITKSRGFNESFEVILKLNVDPTLGDQNVRGTCILPAGIGKEVKVCVFADQEFHP